MTTAMMHAAHAEQQEIDALARRPRRFESESALKRKEHTQCVMHIQNEKSKVKRRDERSPAPGF